MYMIFAMQMFAGELSYKKALTKTLINTIFKKMKTENIL